jgi:dTDP-glucose 4,6-dehydratase
MNETRWLVAGGLGFIGSAFVRLALRDRAHVSIVVLDALTYAGNPQNLAAVAADPRYRFVHGDIQDGPLLDEIIGGGIDVVVNFAAETHVDRSILDAGAFLRTGVLGVQSILDAVRRSGVRRFVQVSTDEVYGDIDAGSSSETDPVRPRSPYAAAKAAGDLLVLAYHETYGTPVLITRGSNTYGPHQYPEKLIPLFLTNLLDGKDVPLYGDGLQIRDWLYVDDHARGVLHVLEHGQDGHVYNLGADNPRTNREITTRLLELTGREWEHFVRHVRDREGHDRRYSLDSAKARALGWQPHVSFETGLAETVQWYRSREDWWRPLKMGDFQQYYAQQYATR